MNYEKKEEYPEKQLNIHVFKIVRRFEEIGSIEWLLGEILLIDLMFLFIKDVIWSTLSLKLLYFYKHAQFVKNL